MSQEPQNYANHRSVDRRLFTFGFFVLAALILAAVAVSGVAPNQTVYFLGLGQLLIGVAVLGSWLRMRVYAVTLQDRIIRLEMKLRLARVLPSDLQGRIDDLTLPQLIGLRYASDAELPDLTRQALDGQLTKADDIKQQIKNWQADHLRV